MTFDPKNPVIILCAKGMELEGQGSPDLAKKLFIAAWETATTDFERFTAANYVARHKDKVADKLQWDLTALQMAVNTQDDLLKGTFPSLYLNVAKCHEDLCDLENARKHYQLALSFTDSLPANGYGQMIRNGILNGLERVNTPTS